MLLNADQYEREQLNRVLNNWRLTPATFAHKLTKGEWIPKDHLLYISSFVAKKVAKGGARIIISAPPRHGKSELTSVHMPAWHLERYPKRNVILSTYGSDLSVGFGRRVRDVFLNEENKELLKTRIRRDSARVAHFITEEGGSMSSVGLGGPITGRGAHLLLIDDYIKEIKEALSPAYRDYIWNWFVTTAYTRLEPGGSVVIVATRWHSDDLIGRILQNFPGQWDYIEMAAEAKEGDILGRPVGAPLFEERYPLSRLQELKETLGSVFYDALYQQSPVDESKKMADDGWLKYVKEEAVPHRNEHKWIRVWDLAATEDGGDYTVGTLCSYHKATNNFYIWNVIRKQISPNNVEESVQKAAVADGVDIDVGIEQEPGSSGKALVEHYDRSVLPEFKVVPIPTAGNSKLIRAQPFLAGAEAGRVYLVEGEWNATFAREFRDFPGGQFDDQIDTAAAAYTKLTGKKIFTASWGRRGGKTANSNATRRAGLVMSVKSQRLRGATFGRRG